MQKGLVGYWDLSKESLKSATVLADKTPYGNNGTSANTPVFTTDRHGQAGKAMSFNGSSDKITFSSFAHNIGTGDFTISAWVYPTVVSGGWDAIFGIGADGFSEPGFYISSSKLQVYWLTGAYTDVFNTTLTNNTWYHFILLRSSGTVKAYINGVQETTTYSRSNNVGTTDIAYIGFDGGAGTNISGSISDVRIYNRALTQVEITQLYNSY